MEGVELGPGDAGEGAHVRRPVLLRDVLERDARLGEAERLLRGDGALLLPVEGVGEHVDVDVAADGVTEAVVRGVVVGGGEGAPPRGLAPGDVAEVEFGVGAHAV